MKKSYVETYHVSKTFRAPLDFVFAWCTDFREGDNKMTGSKSKRKILEKTEKRILWIVEYKEKGETREGVRVVWPHPPDSWHLDTCGDGKELGEYRLSPKGKNKTRLDMEFRITYDDKDEIEDKDEWEKETRELWDIFAWYLEKDYEAHSKKGAA